MKSTRAAFLMLVVCGCGKPQAKARPDPVAGSKPQSMILKRADVPEPKTIAALRAIDRLTSLGQCDLPAAQPAPSRFASADSTFTFGLPEGWTAESISTGGSGPVFIASITPAPSTPPGSLEQLVLDSAQSWGNRRPPEAVFTSTSKGRITIRRVPTGSSSRTFIAYPNGQEKKPSAQCEISDGKVGGIWTFYDDPYSDTPGSRIRYKAMGDVVSSSGRRYSIYVGSDTTAERAEIVMRLARAALAEPGY